MPTSPASWSSRSYRLGKYLETQDILQIFGRIFCTKSLGLEGLVHLVMPGRGQTLAAAHMGSLATIGSFAAAEGLGARQLVMLHSIVVRRF